MFLELKTDLPNAAAMRVSKETDKVVAQVRSLSQIVAKQGKDISRATKIIDGLSNQLESFESQLIGAEKLNEDVAALVTLEREKYLEVLQRQAELQEQMMQQLQGQQADADLDQIEQSIGFRPHHICKALTISFSLLSRTIFFVCFC